MNNQQSNSSVSPDIEEIAERAERGEDISAYFTGEHTVKQYVHIDFSLTLLRAIDKECRQVGVTRQAWIKMACEERLQQAQAGRVKQAIAVLMLLIVTVLVPVQIGKASVTKKANLTGSWKLDMDASSFTLSKRDLVFDGIVLEIDHQDPQLKMTRKISWNNAERVQKLLYHCDGKGEVNPALAGSNTIKSRTSWNGNVLVTTSTGSHGPYTTESCQVLELSPDGQTLTEYSLPNIPEFGVFVQNSPELLGRNKTKRIYRKMA